MNNQIILIDEKTENQWYYDIDPEIWPALMDKGKFDDQKRLILSHDIVQFLKKYTPERANAKINSIIKKFEVPEVKRPEYQEIELPNLSIASHQELENLLSYFGSWRSYLEARLGEVEAERTVLESTLAPSINKALARLHIDERWEREKKPSKDILVGIVLNENPQIRKVQLALIEAEGAAMKVRGMRDQFRTYYETISRVVALRTTFKDEY